MTIWSSPTAKKMSFWVASKKDWVEQKTSFELRSKTCNFMTARAEAFQSLNHCQYEATEWLSDTIQVV